jgi:hypothetical protein
VADLSLVRRLVTSSNRTDGHADVNLDGNISTIDVELIRNTLETKYEESTKIILVVFLTALLALLGFLFINQKKIPTPTPAPQATWQLTPAVQNIRMGESAIFELTLTPFQNQTIDGFDLIFDQAVQIKERLPLDFRQLEKTAERLFLFALSTDTQRFALQTPLIIEQIIFTQ